VSFPFGDHTRYDLILDDSENLYRAQVKKAREKQDGVKILFNCSSGSDGKSYTKEDIDVFIVHYAEEDAYYWVDVEDTGKSVMALRLEEPENGQTANINFSPEYRI
jgi:hypothetical protein